MPGSFGAGRIGTTVDEAGLVIILFELEEVAHPGMTKLELRWARQGSAL
jgi:hypothetical protein